MLEFGTTQPYRLYIVRFFSSWQQTIRHPHLQQFSSSERSYIPYFLPSSLFIFAFHSLIPLIIYVNITKQIAQNPLQQNVHWTNLARQTGENVVSGHYYPFGARAMWAAPCPTRGTLLYCLSGWFWLKRWDSVRGWWDRGVLGVMCIGIEDEG